MAPTVRRRHRKLPSSVTVHAVVEKLPNNGDDTYYALPWSSPDGIGRANCFSYAIDRFEPHRTVKLQPGDMAAQRRGYIDRQSEAQALGITDTTTCSNIRARMKDDLGDDVYIERPRTPCQKNFHKIMLVIGRNKRSSDYHYYRNFQNLLLNVSGSPDRHKIAKRYKVPIENVVQTKPGYVLVRNANVWASKHGFATGALLTDTCGKPIFDPRMACRKVGDLDYKIFCDSFCVRSQRNR